MIRQLSIQTFKLKSNISIEEPYPKWFDISVASKKDKKVVGQMLKKTRFQKNACGKKSETIDDPDITKQIDSFINATFGSMKCYKNIGIKTIRKSNTARKECYWISTDSNYCLNVKREHSSAEAYFELNYDKIIQRCYSAKKAIHDRENGVCKEFRSSKFFPLPLKLKKKLFPEKYEEVNKKYKSINGVTETEPDTKLKKDFSLNNLMKTSIFDQVNQMNFGYISDNSDIN
jgi:hypothetical protein